MFFPREVAELPQLGVLCGLRRALNQPLVSREAGGVAAARASIAVHRSPRGGRQISVCVHVEGEPHARLYVCDTLAHSEGELERCLKAALYFGERFGFVFDEDELPPGGEAAISQGTSVWLTLLESSAPRAAVFAQGPSAVLTKFRRG